MEFNLKSLSTIAVLIVVAVVLLGVGISINDTLSEDFVDAKNFGYNNETFTLNDTVAEVFSEDAEPNCVMGGQLFNATGGEEIDQLNNWTFDTKCSIIGEVGSPYIGEDVNFTGGGSYDQYTDGYYVTENGTDAMSNVSTKVPLIATIAALAVILTLIFGAFALRKF